MLPDQKVLVVITARGGSKSVPRKNIREVAGRPLIDYAIKAALGAGDHVYKVVVSTEDEEIADIARTCGAEVPFMRPAELATDEAPSLLVVQHAIKEIEQQDNVTIDWVLLIQPTNPLIESKDVKAAIDLIDDQATSVVSVVSTPGNHPFKALKMEEGFLKPYIENAPQAIRRQDLEPVYKRNGSMYMTRRDVLLEQNDMFGDHMKPCIMAPETAIDIDTEFDLKIVDFILSNK